MEEIYSVLVVIHHQYLIPSFVFAVILGLLWLAFPVKGLFIIYDYLKSTNWSVKESINREANELHHDQMYYNEIMHFPIWLLKIFACLEAVTIFVMIIVYIVYILLLIVAVFVPLI